MRGASWGPALDLLARARQAIEDVTGSRVHRMGLLDGIANDVVLPEVLWDIASVLRIQTALRAEHGADMLTGSLREAVAAGRHMEGDRRGGRFSPDLQNPHSIF